MSTLASTIGRGVTGSRPAASEAGRLYYDTTALIWYRDNGSSWDNCTPSALTNPMTGVGAIIQGTTAGAPVELAAPLAGKVLTGAGVTTPVAYKYPPGYEFDYVGSSSSVTINQTTEGTAVTCLTGGSVTYDGSTVVLIEVFCPRINTSTTSGGTIVVLLYEDSTVIGRLGLIATPAAASMIQTFFAAVRRTPSNASHQYVVKAYSTAGTNGTWTAGAGGTGVEVNAYIRVRKV